MPNVATLYETMSYGPAPESPDAAEAWLGDHDRRFDLFVDGEWRAPSEERYMETSRPATGEPLAEVADAGEGDVDAAVEAARRAQGEWASLSGHERARHLYALARELKKHARLFAVLEAMDNGKPIRETRDLDTPLVARHFYHHAGWAQLMDKEFAEYEPVGVAGQVIPWNFPLLMMAWKVAPALATGNTVVLKPAPYTPLTALLFAEVAASAGLPDGVLNVVTGGDEAGAAVVDADVDKVAFTGSTQVGRLIRRATAGSGKRLSLELGGKSPYVVFDDADQEGAVEGLVNAIWFNQGQVCCAGSRLLVQESIAEEFLEKVRERMSKLRVGDSLDKGVDIGAIIDPVQYETIEAWVEQGLDEGAEMYQPDVFPENGGASGDGASNALPEDGCFYPPTLLTNVEPASTVVQEEIFGPVLVAMTFRTPEEAIKLANNTRYGLAGSVWSENVNLALEAAHRIKAGSLWVNGTNFFDAASGFGGYRESGYGREGGREGLFEYLRPKWQDRPRPSLPENGADGNAEENESADDQAQDDWGAHTPTRPSPVAEGGHANADSVDRTTKLYIGGAQRRPDGDYSRVVRGPEGEAVGTVSDGNRKDIRDAVEAAHAARGWADRTPHNRAQVLYFIAENLDIRSGEFARRLRAMMGVSKKKATREVEQSVERLFTYAAWADKYGGTVQETTLGGFVVAHREPVGVVGIACPDEKPLLAFVSLVAPAIARGNSVVALPSQPHPLAATDLFQVLDTSDLPGGVVNIVTGDRDHLARTLVEHDDVAAMWYFGPEGTEGARGSREVEARSATNMKRTWVGYGERRDWATEEQGEGRESLREAVQVKNIWIPTGF
jgi:aldehyde dehydrogenase (NAD+)